MRFGVMLDADMFAGGSDTDRFQEMLVEAEAAEAAGFDLVGAPQFHFSDRWSMSSPEIFLSAVAARTERIRMRFVAEILLNFNHPIRVAERLATLDCLSNGRIEFGTARGNDLPTLQAFGVSPDETVDQWRENLDVVLGALSSETFSHQGKYWNIPERRITPTGVQRPHPPAYLVASSLDTHKTAGELGLGVVTASSQVKNWEEMTYRVKTYRDAAADPHPIAGQATNSIGLYFLGAHCAGNRDQALDEGYPPAEAFLEDIVQRRTRLGNASVRDNHNLSAKSYQDWLDEYIARGRDRQWLARESTFLAIGTPEDLVTKFRLVESLGFDEIILKIDGMGHEAHMGAIKLIGSDVIPEFR